MKDYYHKILKGLESLKHSHSYVQAAKIMNVTPQSINRAIKNNGSSCGYNWIYKNGNSKESSINRV
jgi:hypothetical protein